MKTSGVFNIVLLKNFGCCQTQGYFPLKLCPKLCTKKNLAQKLTTISMVGVAKCCQQSTHDHHLFITLSVLHDWRLDVTHLVARVYLHQLRLVKS